MLTQTGSFTGTGSRRVITLDFEPTAFFLKGNHTQHGVMHIEGQWCDRSVGMANDDSLNNCISFKGIEVHMGAVVNVAASGVAFVWMAIGKDENNDLETQSWMGNGQNGHVITLQSGKTPKGLFIKRDSALSGFTKTTSGTSRPHDGAVGGTVGIEGEPVSAVTAGSITLSNLKHGNQYSSASGLGEGIDGIFWMTDNDQVEVVEWTGNASGGRLIASSISPIAAIVTRDDATQTNQARFATRTATYPMGASAAVAGDPTLGATGLTVGTAFGNLNTIPYRAFFFSSSVDIQPAAPAIITGTKKAVYLPGRDVASVIDCGTSDATLDIDGAMTMEWFGIPFYSAAPGIEPFMQLIGRGLGPVETDNAYSWGMFLKQEDEFTHRWPGPQFMHVVVPRLQTQAPLDTACWRTGVIGRYGTAQHVMTTFDGTSAWRMFVNGRLVKQRNIALARTSSSGHRTGIGAWQNGSAWANPGRMAFISARVYSAALSLADCVTRFEIAALGSAAADITSNLAEAWSASAASGFRLPASVNGANDGTIVGGRVVEL